MSTREIIVVTCIDSENTNLEDTRAFTNYDSADLYMKSLIRKYADDKSDNDLTDDELDCYVEDGYYEANNVCIYMNVTTLYMD